MIRCFAAIDLPAALKRELHLIQLGLPMGRLIDADNLHLTLVFLGELPETTVEDIDAAFGQITRPGFELQLSGLGMFGGAKPRHVYAGVSDSAELLSLQSKVMNAARRAGAKPDNRRYIPHVSLARVGQSVGDVPKLERFVASRVGAIGDRFMVGSFALYRSYLRSGGSIYEEMARYELGGGQP